MCYRLSQCCSAAEQPCLVLFVFAHAAHIAKNKLHYAKRAEETIYIIGYRWSSSLISIDINCDAITKEDCPRHHDSVTPSHDPYNTEHRLFTLHWSLGALMAKIAKRSKEQISQLLPSVLRLQWYRSRNSLATSCKIYSVSSQTKYGNFTWNLIHTSVIRRDPFLRP